MVPDVWEKLIAEYHPRTVLDVGCGYGHAVKWFIEHGIIALGIEGYSAALWNNAAPLMALIEHDFTAAPFHTKATFDLCWCCEFVEHVEERFIPNFMPCFQACRHVAMTHAKPGQGGFHHVNERTAEYWVNTLRDFGFQWDEEATKKFRRPAKYGVNNLLIFHNEKLA